mmetsp:Transcript_12405/g.57410  ORF Transcript_12405/g.57410 Transcript_12405/m.57410 type:complete len:219 (+) Transcript_12405:154-810(+)
MISLERALVNATLRRRRFESKPPVSRRSLARTNEMTTHSTSLPCARSIVSASTSCRSSLDARSRAMASTCALYGESTAQSVGAAPLARNPRSTRVTIPRSYSLSGLAPSRSNAAAPTEEVSRKTTRRIGSVATRSHSGKSVGAVTGAMRVLFATSAVAARSFPEYERTFENLASSSAMRYWVRSSTTEMSPCASLSRCNSETPRPRRSASFDCTRGGS